MRERDSLLKPLEQAAAWFGGFAKREATANAYLALLKDWQILDAMHANGGRQDQYDKTYALICKKRDELLRELQS